MRELIGLSHRSRDTAHVRKSWRRGYPLPGTAWPNMKLTPNVPTSVSGKSNICDVGNPNLSVGVKLGIGRILTSVRKS